MPTYSRQRRAFTLIELMLSIGMVLILVLGINYVFRSATTAVGAGQTQLELIRTNAAAQALLFKPFDDVVKNPPFFAFASQVVPQFLNLQDAQSNPGGPSSNPLIIPTDNAGNAAFVNPYDTTGANVAIYGYRAHRADIIRFFAHGDFSRHTGDDGSYISSTTSDDACITIGHAALPNVNLNADGNGDTYFSPASDFAYGNTVIPGSMACNFNAANRVGAYASDWVLARNVILLKDATSISGEHHYIRGTPPGNLSNMTPLSSYTPDDTAGSPPDNSQILKSSRYDLAATTIDEFRRIVSDEVVVGRTAIASPLAAPVANANGPGNTPVYTGYATAATGATNPAIYHLWWEPLLFYWQGPTTVNAQTTAYSYQVFSTPVNAAAPAVPVFYNVYQTSPQTAPPSNYQGLPVDNDHCPLHFQANPLVSTPVTATSIAQLTPYFLQHCSQFIVEYAGDYMQQNNDPTPGNTHYGNMTGVGPDGQIDFYVDQAGNKHIRWYGLPRSTTGNPHPSGPPTDPNLQSIYIRGPIASVDDPTADSVLNYFTDVIPLRDYYTMWFEKANTDTNTYAPPWEVEVNFPFPTGTDPVSGKPSCDYARSPNFTAGVRYACAWNNDTPSLVRIIIKVDDPNNQVKDGPWYEYVFRLK